MTETFKWQVTTQSSGGGEFAVFVAKFGDNYSQEIPNGLNNETQSWNVAVSDYKAVVADVLAFLRAQQGRVFFWTAPFDTAPGYYKCKKYSSLSDAGGGYWSMSMTFEQGYAP